MSIRARAHGPELQCFAKFVSVPYHFKLNVSRRFLFSLIWVVALWHLIKGLRYHDIVYRQGLFIVSSAPMSPSTKFLDPREQLLPFAVVKMPLAESQDVRSKPSPKFPLNVAPESWRPYMELIRLEKPTGTKLMFWPFTWGVTMALYSSNPTISPSEYSRKLLMCLVWAFIMRSSACTVNDIFDRHMDAGVERCKNRPLPSGRISVAAASVYLAIQYVIGGLVFYFTLDGIAFYVALFQLLPLFAIYPLLKRFTHWPQAWLGFAMNFGFITGWVSVTDSLDYNVLLFAIIACWCWTMIYDTIYACQDVIDDLKTGVHSTAILFGTWILPLLAGCACIFVTALFVVGCLNHHGPAYFIVSVGGTALHLVWQFKTVRLESPESCWENFNRNGQLGWIVWAGLLADFSLKAGSLNAILAAVA